MSSLDRRRDHLRLQLTQLAPADEREARFRDRMLTLLDDPGDPFSRGHFVPGHFTASAFVLSPLRDAVLMVLHGKLHRWLQPGGHVDPQDADLMAAARREVTEETAIVDLAPVGEVLDVDVHDIPGIGSAPPHLHFDVRFLFVAGSRATIAGSDARASRWVPLASVNHVESDESVMRAVAKIHAIMAVSSGTALSR